MKSQVVGLINFGDENFSDANFNFKIHAIYLGELKKFLRKPDERQVNRE